ncbi:MAG TPA: hypothetical protein DCY07_05675 [Rhodospirillaceae bacterium]|nr:hypothetical protein [Rhodospirillaceae bacterium]
MKRLSSQSGFTLVELSIVLVIIGLIIGGVLTGQQIIQNARITNAINAIQAYQGQIQTYAQNNGALPGDDAGAVARFPSMEVGVNGNGNGKIGTASSFDTAAAEGEATESLHVWAHLRAAGLVKNQVTGGTTAIQPPNPFGGVFGIQNTAFAGALPTGVICMDKVTAGAAQAIDARLDDGAPDAGAIQSTTYTGAVGSSANAAVTTYSDDNTYTMCVRM